MLSKSTFIILKTFVYYSFTFVKKRRPWFGSSFGGLTGTEKVVAASMRVSVATAQMLEQRSSTYHMAVCTRMVAKPADASSVPLACFQTDVVEVRQVSVKIA